MSSKTPAQMTIELAEAMGDDRLQVVSDHAVWNYSREPLGRWKPFDSRDDCWMVLKYLAELGISIRVAVILNARLEFLRESSEEKIRLTLLLETADIATACHAAIVEAGKIQKPKGE